MLPSTRRLTRNSFSTSPLRAGVIALRPTPPRYAPSTLRQRTRVSGICGGDDVPPRARPHDEPQRLESERDPERAEVDRREVVEEDAERRGGRRARDQAQKRPPRVARARGGDLVRLAPRARPAAARARRLAAGRVRERLREQPVGEPRVARQQRAVEVRADRRGRRGSPRSRSRRRCRSRATTRPSGSAPSSSCVRPAWFSKPASVRPAHSQSSRTSPIMRRSPATVWSGKRPMPGQLGAVAVAVEAAEQLVAAADREDGRAARRPPRARRRAFAARSTRDERLLAVLAAADVEQVVRARPQRVAHRDRLDVELVPAPGRAPREHRDVAAVGVDVQVVRIEVPDADLHAARSQYGRTWPRSPMILRSASIAV